MAKANDWMWVSFAEPGSHGFLGVAIIRGFDAYDGAQEAGRLGINPGGAVMGTAILVDKVPPSFRERLLNRAEALMLQDTLELRYATEAESHATGYGCPCVKP
jgi:hypothetical protein